MDIMAVAKEANEEEHDPDDDIPRWVKPMITPMKANVDRKSTRLNSSHTEIYTLSLHDALPIYGHHGRRQGSERGRARSGRRHPALGEADDHADEGERRSEEHTSELQSHRDLHSFPTRRSSDLWTSWPSPRKRTRKSTIRTTTSRAG